MYLLVLLLLLDCECRSSVICKVIEELIPANEFLGVFVFFRGSFVVCFHNIKYLLETDDAVNYWDSYSGEGEYLFHTKITSDHLHEIDSSHDEVIVFVELAENFSNCIYFRFTHHTSAVGIPQIAVDNENSICLFFRL